MSQGGDHTSDTPSVQTFNRVSRDKIATGLLRAADGEQPDAPADADLRAVVNVWPTLPDPIKAGVLAMVKAASDSAPECP